MCSACDYDIRLGDALRGRDMLEAMIEKFLKAVDEAPEETEMYEALAIFQESYDNYSNGVDL